MSNVVFNTRETHLRDGRRVAMWTLAPQGGTVQSLPMVIGSGFARRMHHFSAIAMYGAQNGFFVSRYDPVNHVGLSDGDMWDFTLSDSLESLSAAVDTTCKITGKDKVIVVATSLTARIAIQLAAQSEKVALVVTAVGVVNIRDTLTSVFGEDHSVHDVDGLDGSVEFEGKLIERKNFCRDAHAHDWWSMSGCVAALRQAKQPMISFIGADDKWVRPSDVEYAYAEGAGGPRKLLTLERAAHDFSRNASVARTFVLRMVDEISSHCGADRKTVEPPFEDIMEQSLLERRIQRGSDTSSTIHGSP